MKKPIAVFITDTHLFEKRSREDSLIDDNIELNISLYRQARKIVKELGLRDLYHGGDIFHSRKGQTERLLNVWKDILNEFENDGITLIAIDGNHDKTDQANSKSFLRPFENHSHFELVKTANYFSLTIDVDLHLISYFPDEEYEKLYKKWISSNSGSATKNVLLTHKTFKGSLLNDGKKSDGGIDVNSINAFDLVLVGHLHNKHSLGKIEYIGASHQHNFGEDDRKGVTVLYDDLSIEQIQLEFPKYVSYSVDPKDITNEDIDLLKKEIEETGNHIKIELKGRKEHVDTFDKQKLKNLGVKVETNVEIVEKEILDKTIEPFNSKSLKEQFEKYCNENKLDVQQGLKYFEKVIK